MEIQRLNTLYHFGVDNNVDNNNKNNCVYWP